MLLRIFLGLVLLTGSNVGRAQISSYPEAYLLEQQHINEVISWEISNGWTSEYHTGLEIILSQDLYSRAAEMAEPVLVTRAHSDDFETSIYYYFSKVDSMVSYIDYTWGVPVSNIEAMRKYLSQSDEELHKEATKRFGLLQSRFEEVLGDSEVIHEDQDRNYLTIEWKIEQLTTRLFLQGADVGAVTYWE